MDSFFWTHAAHTLKFQYFDGDVTVVDARHDTGWRVLPYLVIAQPTLGQTMLEFEGVHGAMVQPGQMMCVAPGVRHRISNRAGHDNISRWCHFNAWIFQSLPLATFFNFTGIVNKAAAERLGDICQQLLSVAPSKVPDAGWTTVLRERALGLEIVAILVESLGALLPEPKHWRDLERLLPALQFIEANLGKTFTREELAARVHLSPSRFASLFVTALGMPPGDYARQQQLLRAQQLLLTTSLGAEEIGRRCGFASPPHFSRHFKARFGLSPAHYRRYQERSGVGGF